jgi:hypothetical protein
MKKYSVILLNGLPDKKIKYLGNRCLIEFKHNENILDYYVKTIKKLLTNFEIKIVCAFDNKKIKKYIQKKYPSIHYLEHELDDTKNDGHGLEIAMNQVKHKNCIIINTNNILLSKAIDKIKVSLDKTFVLTSNNTHTKIGFIENKGFVSNCYYGLPKNIYDILYIEQNNFDKAQKLTKDISNMFLFEIINKYISNGIKISPLFINSKDIKIINSPEQIKEIKKQVC